MGLYNIYKNIIIYVKYINHSVENVLSEDEFNSEMNKTRYYKVIAINDKNKDDKRVIVLFDNNNTSILKNAQFKKFTQVILADHPGMHIMCVVDNELITKNKLSDNGICRLIKKSIFLTNLMDNTNVVHKYSILTEDEKDVSFNFIRKQSDSLAHILYDDPLSIWIDAKVGDILKLDRVSENTGKSVSYRLVV